MTLDLQLPVDAATIRKLLPHRYPFLLVDRVVEFEKDKRVLAYKNITQNEPFFTGHFPDRPIMPGVLGHLEICDRVVVTAMSLVTSSITEPGEYSSGTPLTDNRTWRKNAARFKQLDALARRVLAADKET